MYSNKYYYIKWRLFSRCNFRCSYCVNYRSLTLYETEDEEYKRLQKQSLQLKELLNNNQELTRISLLLIGGEVTLIPCDKLLQLIEPIKDKLYHLHITTNFTASVEYYGKIADWCANNNIEFYLTSSLHEEFFKVDRFIDKAITVNKMIAEKNKLLERELLFYSVENVVTKSNFKTAEYIAEKLKENGVRELVDYNRFEQWTLEERTIQTTTGNAGVFRSSYSNTEETFGYTCSNNLWQMSIRPDGKLYGSCCSGAKPFGMLGLTKKIPFKEVICWNKQCALCGKMYIKRPDGTLFFEAKNTANMVDTNIKTDDTLYRQILEKSKNKE